MLLFRELCLWDTDDGICIQTNTIPGMHLALLVRICSCLKCSLQQCTTQLLHIGKGINFCSYKSYKPTLIRVSVHAFTIYCCTSEKIVLHSKLKVN